MATLSELYFDSFNMSDQFLKAVGCVFVNIVEFRQDPLNFPINGIYTRLHF